MLKGKDRLNILSVDKITKSYSEKVLFEELSLLIQDGDKIGLIGVNGTGKTTMMNIIAGIESPDQGRIIIGNDIRVEYLPQNPEFESGITVLQQILKGDSPIMELLRAYEYTLLKTIECPEEGQWNKQLLNLTQKMDSMDAWSIEKDIKIVLSQLGISDFDADVGTLSGGQKKRVAIASALINPADLLILDEPTNHIDNITIVWLEKYLNKRKGALLMVTHDRYFLDRIVNRIIELDNGTLYGYQANYSVYLQLKAEREEMQLASESKRKNLYRRELEWIQRGAQARSTKQKARIDRFEKLKEKDSMGKDEGIEIKAGSSRLGRKTIVLEHIFKSYSDLEVIHDFNYIILRDDRVGIIGPNGSGKSTLLKIIAERLEPDSGKVDRGDTVKIGFFSQENEEMDETLRVIEYIRKEAEAIIIGKERITASQMLELFLFPVATQWTSIAKLSGGEKRRLYLLRILMGAPNILLLDEPTNDLDILTLSILESYLEDFQGAVVVASHDRYFLDRTVQKLFAFQGKGRIQQYPGNYTTYVESMQEMLDGLKDENRKTAASQDRNDGYKKERPLRFTFKEQREYGQIDEMIATLEKDLKNIHVEIEIAASDYEKLQQLFSLKESIEEQLELAMDRWIYLTELAEKIKVGNKSSEGEE